MESIKVSVILPVYNVEKYLRACLDSLVNQTLKDIEIICVNDGSTDSSLEILNEYKAADERIVVIEQQNMYAGVARNNGMAIARGEYLAFLDADDFFDLTLLEKTYGQGKKTEADVVLFGAKRYNNTFNKTDDAPWYFRRSLLPSKDVFSGNEIPSGILKVSYPVIWNKIFRREFIEREGIKFQPLHNSNDLFFSFVSVALAEKITYVDEALVYYRVGLAHNLQSEKSQHPACFLEAYESTYNELVRKNIPQFVLNGFVEMALAGCAANIDSAADHETRMKVIKAISVSEFAEKVLLSKPIDFYVDEKQYQKVLGCTRAYEANLKLEAIDKEKETVCIRKAQFKEQPLVSVIIPIYNVEEYIAECLESILSQTLENIEVICVNDGSPDSSFDIVKAYAEKDSRISLYEQPNMGLAETRNRAMNNASGKYIYFIDSDDMLDTDALRQLVERAEKDNLDMVFFDLENFYDKNSEIEPSESFINAYRRTCDYSKPAYSGQELMSEFERNGEYWAVVVQYIFRKDFQAENSIYHIKGIVYEDVYFTFQSLLFAERVGYVSEAFYKRRVRDDSIMRTKVRFANAYGYFRSYIEMSRLLEEYPQVQSNREISNIVNKIATLLRRTYAQLDDEEKYAYLALDDYLKNIFEICVVDAVYRNKDVYGNFEKIRADRMIYRERLYAADADKRKLYAKLKKAYKKKEDLNAELKELERQQKKLRRKNLKKAAELEKAEKRLAVMDNQLKHPVRYVIRKLLRFLHIKK